MKNTILVKTPQYEVEFSDLCQREYNRINNLLFLIEKEFDVDMNNHREIRSEILNISNFIKRLPNMISEVI